MSSNSIDDVFDALLDPAKPLWAAELPRRGQIVVRQFKNSEDFFDYYELAYKEEWQAVHRGCKNWQCMKKFIEEQNNGRCLLVNIDRPAKGDITELALVRFNLCFRIGFYQPYIQPFLSSIRNYFKGLL